MILVASLPFLWENAMNAKDAILNTYSFGDRIVESYLGDLSDADLLVRPTPGANHIAWQLGHLIASEHVMLESIKPGSSPALPAGFADAHGRDEASLQSDDPKRFSTKDQYLSLMRGQRAATRALLSKTTEEELDAPAAERFRKMVPTVGAVFQLAGNHVLMHVGQFASVRRKLNKPVVI
jgi:hypothetical protein